MEDTEESNENFKKYEYVAEESNKNKDSGPYPQGDNVNDKVSKSGIEMAFFEIKEPYVGNNNQPKCVDAEGKCKIAREGVSKINIYPKKWILTPEIIKVRDVCLAGVMDHEVKNENKSCFDPNFDANVDEFHVDENRNKCQCQ